MKLRQHNSTPQQTSDYVHPWDAYVAKLKQPKPPTQEAIEKAKFVDKTFHWGGDLRSGNKRASK